MGYETSSDSLDAPKLKPEDGALGSAGFDAPKLNPEDGAFDSAVLDAPKTLVEAGEADEAEADADETGLNWNIFDGAAEAGEAGVSSPGAVPLSCAGLLPNGLIGVFASSNLSPEVDPNPLKAVNVGAGEAGLSEDGPRLKEGNDEEVLCGFEKEKAELDVAAACSGLLGLRTNSSIFLCASIGNSLRLRPAKDAS